MTVAVGVIAVDPARHLTAKCIMVTPPEAKLGTCDTKSGKGLKGWNGKNAYTFARTVVKRDPFGSSLRSAPPTRQEKKSHTSP